MQKKREHLLRECSKFPGKRAMDIVGIGALNYDKLYMVDNIAGGGDEELVHSLTEAPGGSAANTITALSRLGINTGFIGTIGTDKEGSFILDHMKQEGVDTTAIKKIKGATGTVIGFVDNKGERALYAYPGVNNAFEIDKKQTEYARSATYLHLSSFTGEKPLDAQKKLLKTLEGQKISFAPGTLYAEKMENIKPIIEESSILFLNLKETQQLTGLNYRDGAKKLLKIGAQTVAITLGSKGCYIADNKKTYTAKAYTAKAVDTTGAGDAFAAGFLYGLLKEKNIQICAKIGNWTASKCITKTGARDGLPYKKELKKQAIF